MTPRKRDLIGVDQALEPKVEEIYSTILGVVLDSNVYPQEVRDRVKGNLRSKRYDLLLDFADSYGGAEASTAEMRYSANQLAALIKKVPRDLRSFGIDPEDAALKKFALAEKRCRRYNQIFMLESRLGRRRSSYLREKSRRWIQKVIGFNPPLPKIWSHCGFGPGASVGVSGNATHLGAKLLAPRWTVTPSALPYALAALRSHAQMWELLLNKEGARHFSWDPQNFEASLEDKVVQVDYNNIQLVPKTARVHRTIAVEPLLNGYLQKGVDVFMRQRLSRFGIDLKDQSRNQYLARLGSMSEEDPYVTIDLSEASDSISIGLARDLLPPPWFHFLNGIRAMNYSLNGHKARYEKFCSMGNGFCFPLETLIFASVCEAVSDDRQARADYSVYGDDIIVRRSLGSPVLKMLRTLGFRHNPDKTFLDGPFRESCGADWFQGEDVRPVTMKSIPCTVQGLFSFHNQTLRSARSTVYFNEVREYLRTLVPSRWRFVRPHPGNADTAFEVSTDLVMSSPHASWNTETWSWRWKELTTYPLEDREIRKRALYSLALLQAALSGASSGMPFTLRRNTRTRVTNVSHHGGRSTFLPSDNSGALPEVLDWAASTP